VVVDGGFAAGLAAAKLAHISAFRPASRDGRQAHFLGPQGMLSGVRPPQHR
jgi:hypothetical protein